MDDLQYEQIPDDLTLEKLPSVVVKLYNKISYIEWFLKQKGKESTPPEEEEKLFTVEDAAKFLFLTVPSVYALVRNREINVCKRSKRLYFLKEDLIAWVKLGRKKTNAEISEATNVYLSNRRKSA